MAEPVDPPSSDDVDPGVGGDPAGDEASGDEQGEHRYKRRVGITLAVLALAGGWISVLQTNASTNEARTTREATRLASEAQTADVVDDGVRSGLAQVEAEVDVFESRSVFDLLPETVAEAGGSLDPVDWQRRLDAALASVQAALDVDEDRITEVEEAARALSLEQSAVVEERVTWNARSSQYDTVLTTLAVAIFLVGFTLVVGRRIRPPFAGPGLVLAVFCLGWAVHIYLKPIPAVDRQAIGATAAGQVALDDDRPEDALERFEEAVAADGEYAPAHAGLGLARLVVANPDLLRNFSITDDSPEALDPTWESIDTALELGGTRDPTILTSAAIAAIVSSDWDLAAERLEEAVALNSRTPGLELARAAVAIAQGDTDAADMWSTRAVEQLEAQAGSDANQVLASQFLTLLEWIGFQEPERGELVDAERSRAIALIEDAREPGGNPVPSPRAQLFVEEVSILDGVTTVDLRSEGVPAGASVIVAGYERPAPGAPWVQPAELFYAGPEGEGTGGALALDTERSCTAVEYRFDLYVEGRFADSVTAGGSSPTC